MENLDLPQLRELYLHRNRIIEIKGLGGCPRLRKLWLCQNRIKEISGLHATPGLEECWLQGNGISSLEGLEQCPSLTNIGLAGNPIPNLRDLDTLSKLPKLVEISLSDVHFGRAPLTDLDGYKPYVLNNIPRVQILDGVLITESRRTEAEEDLGTAARQFAEHLNEIEDDFRHEIQLLSNKQKSKEKHCNILEREMTEALHELQGLVETARENIQAHVESQQQVLNTNISQLKGSVFEAARKARKRIDDRLVETANDFDWSEASFFLLERLLSAEGECVSILCKTTLGEGKDPSSVQPDLVDEFGNELLEAGASNEAVLFHGISENAPEFQWFSNTVQGKIKAHSDGLMEVEESKYANRVATCRLFRIAVPPPLLTGYPAGSSETSGVTKSSWSSFSRVYTVMTPEALSRALQGQWSSDDLYRYHRGEVAGQELHKSHRSAIICSSSAGAACELFAAFGDSFNSPIEVFPTEAQDAEIALKEVLFYFLSNGYLSVFVMFSWL